ncbi:cation:proton antiporter [Pseudalkalibacillus caeni]|uniref:Cation:proton antiporter n=1 Tax=Exobacillus caeni TaxID=2574798 RepID=A0A5R9F0K5_9BACL|nr:cation:proton antiporter [Pseudalkalibacillus caeni]TLS35966.1 cation:proton antiporter [Pseudalkalibacillus caeni]
MNLPLAIGLVLLALSITGLIGIKMIRIPDLVLYILLGIALKELLPESKVIEVAGEIGLVLLFFLLGMKFSVGEFARNGKRVWKAGLLDVLLGIGVTTLICYLFDLNFLTCLIIAGIVYATSSSMSAKLLESTNRMENRESDFMLSLLIFEDLVAPILVTVLIGLSGDGFTATDFILIFLKVALLTGVAVFFSKIVFKKAQILLDKVTDDDVFIVLVIGIALGYGGLALYLGLSEIIGAFLAGIMLADTQLKDKIKDEVLPVRNIFLPFFFLHFGITMELTKNIPSIELLFLLLIWSIIHKLIVGYVGGKWYGLSGKEALQGGISLTPRGEFSVIIAGLATGGLKVFAGMYILVAALVGMLLFQFAPKITKLFYRKAEKVDD